MFQILSARTQEKQKNNNKMLRAVKNWGLDDYPQSSNFFSARHTTEDLVKLMCITQAFFSATVEAGKA